MKMPRSHCENENLQFVQELAEVDGPFESPININFRDLTKLDLPSLNWNHCDACPKKMKITNTGHTVIVSGKWKCERPYLTGGPLLGKYVFSQIHFHWGQDDCKGSEHLVCGEGFPLEMHVAHFKTDYMNQECALKERDGMVILVYLFKLQEEPNVSLKKILNCLPNIRQANTSQQLDPKPILSLCNPFTDDYFMYWGSVVTSTCAHILMWLVCREPFGISREQVNEFRQILDSSQQPICRNNRETQPLHKRNVFHVNASKNLDYPLLPVKKIVGCFCGRGSEDNESIRSSKDCCCRGSLKDQEDVQENYTEMYAESLYFSREDREPKCRRMAHQPQDYHFHQSVFVQSATVHSDPLLPKFYDRSRAPRLWPSGSTRETEGDKGSKVKLVSQSCCFIVKDVEQVKVRQEKRRSRQSSFNSMRALSHIMESLEALKKHTRKRLKEIDLINQEIKGMKSFYEDSEDKKWLKKIEKIMSGQKDITSYGCLSEIKKLAKEYHIDQFFEKKMGFSLKKSNKLWLNKVSTQRDFLYFGGAPTKTVSKTKSKSYAIDKAIKFSNKAQRLIRSFFEDIQETESLHQNLKMDFNLNKKKSILPNEVKSSEKSTTDASVEKGCITQKMFNRGKLEDRFFIEVESEEAEESKEMVWAEQHSQTPKLFECLDSSQTENQNETESSFDKKATSEEMKIFEEKTTQESIIPLHRVDVPVGSVKSDKSQLLIENVMPRKKGFEADDESQKRFLQSTFSDTESSMDSYLNAYAKEKIMRKKLDKSTMNIHSFTSDSSSKSSGTRRIVFAELQEERSLITSKTSSKILCNKQNGKRQKSKNINFEGYFIKRKNLKKKEKKVRKAQNGISSEFSSKSKDLLSGKGERKWKNLTKARFKLKIEKTSDSTIESAIECSFASLKNKEVETEKTNKSFEDDGHVRENVEQSCKSSPKIFELNNQQPDTSRDDKKEDNELFDLDESNDRSVEVLKGESIEVSKKQSLDRAKGTVETSCEVVEKPEEDQKVKDAEVNDSFKSHTPIFKKTVKNRSFTSVSIRFKNHTADTKKRIFVQTNEDRCNLVRDFLDFKQFKTFDFKKEIIFEPHKTSNSKIKILKPKMKGEEVIAYDTRGESQFDVGFLTTSGPTQNGNFLSETYVEEGKGEIVENLKAKREKENLLQDDNLISKKDVVPQEGNKSEENVTKTESEKSIGSIGTDMKGDANAPLVETKELLSTASYTTTKNNSPSRPRSFENLTFPTKSNKRKRKKRPHCSNRISRHYIRKNSCVFGKSDKIDNNKPLNFINLTAEEQLKIISMNVAKYLKQKYIDQEQNVSDEKKENDVDKIEPKISQEKIQEPERTETTTDLPKIVKMQFPNHEKIENENQEEQIEKETIKQTVEPQQDAIPTRPSEVLHLEKPHTTKKLEKEESTKVEEIVPDKIGKETAKTKKPSSPRPPLNFIKLNKLMAGKYKRSNTADSKTENSETQKKTEEPKKEVPKTKTSMMKNLNLNNDPDSKKAVNRKTGLPVKTPEKGNKKTTKKNRVKSPEPKKIQKSLDKKGCEKSLPENKEGVNEKADRDLTAKDDENGADKSRFDHPSFSKNLNLDQTPSTLVPTYMMTSYVAPSVDVPENQQSINQFLINVKRKNINAYIPDMMYETQNYNDIKAKTNDTVFAKDLENLIKLQMCLNNEIAANIENSMNYIKTLLSQDYSGNAIVEKAPVNDTFDYYDSSQNGIVLIEMNDLMACSTSSSECREEIETCKFIEEENPRKFDFQVKEIINASGGMPKEFGDTKIINPVFVQDLAESDEEYYSDSSYNCEILITLNGSTKDITEIKNHSETGNSDECPVPSVQLLRKESHSSQVTTHLEGGHSSQSIILKPVRKKRKENEISVEMKKKLLEILEGEIRREMALSYQGSPDNSSDALTLVWDESVGTNRSQSLVESSSDNTEVLAQISETMRQYLTEYKRRRMVKKKLDTLEKNEDDFMNER